MAVDINSRSLMDRPVKSVIDVLQPAIKPIPNGQTMENGIIGRSLAEPPQPIGESIPVGATVVSNLSSVTAESSGQGR